MVPALPQSLPLGSDPSRSDVSQDSMRSGHKYVFFLSMASPGLSSSMGVKQAEEYAGGDLS